MTMRKPIHGVCALGCVALLFGVATALAAPARIDQGFGGGGIARTPLPPAYDVQPFDEVVATGDGGVVTRSGSYGDVEVRHYRANGTVVGTETLKEADFQRPEAATGDGGGFSGDASWPRTLKNTSEPHRSETRWARIYVQYQSGHFAAITNEFSIPEISKIGMRRPMP